MDVPVDTTKEHRVAHNANSHRSYAKYTYSGYVVGLLTIYAGIATESTRNDGTTIKIRQAKDMGAGVWIPILHGEKQFELSELNLAVQFWGGTSAFDLNWVLFHRFRWMCQWILLRSTEWHIMLIVIIAMPSITTESTRNDGTTIEIRQVKDTGAGA
ncbi:hypothetical protein F5146DRAFT_1007291 [Armillaria mellea]|nr:hypothetical protein F5146DRAFT_1007291 [Armillaria mellea]